MKCISFHCDNIEDVSILPNGKYCCGECGLMFDDEDVESYKKFILEAKRDKNGEEKLSNEPL